MSKVVLVTPTKDRPEQLSLTIDCINDQSLVADEWVIVDDGAKPVPKFILDKIQIPHKYIHWTSGQRISCCANSAKMLEEAHSDKYVIIEDDDYYPCCYLENICSLLTGKEDLVGNLRRFDYRLSTGYYRISLKLPELMVPGEPLWEWHHVAFCGEGLKQDMISALLTSNTVYPDCACYRSLFHNGPYKKHAEDFGDWSCLSLKDYGVGTGGVVGYHRSNNLLTRDDDNFSFFKNYLGEDWKRYEKYLGRLRDK